MLYIAITYLTLVRCLLLYKVMSYVLIHYYFLMIILIL